MLRSRELFSRSPAQGSACTESVRLGFAVKDADEAVAKLEMAGAAVVSEAKDSPWGRRAVVKDFDGHSVELTSIPASSR